MHHVKTKDNRMCDITPAKIPWEQDWLTSAGKLQ